MLSTRSDFAQTVRVLSGVFVCVRVCVPMQLSPASWERASLYVLALMCGKLEVTIGGGGGGGGGGGRRRAILSFAFIASPDGAD